MLFVDAEFLRVISASAFASFENRRGGRTHL